MSKVSFKHDLSLRSKFKTEDVVEVTVVDHTTLEEFQLLIRFRDMKFSKKTKSLKGEIGSEKSEQPASDGDSHDEDSD